MGSFDKMVQDMDDPNVQVKGKMAEDIAGTATEDTTPKDVPAAAEAVTNPQPEPKPEPKGEEPVSSFLTEQGDAPPTPHVQTRVPIGIPIGVLQKERQRRQEAERQLAELQAAQEQKSESEIDLSQELKDLLGDEDDDFVDKKTAIEMLNRTGRKVAKETRDSVLRTIQQERQDEAVKAESQSRKAFLLQSEAAARKTFSNFDAVVSTALKTGTLTADELEACRNAPNPGAALYLKSKRVLTDLEIAVPQGAASAAGKPQTSVPEQQQKQDGGEEMDDETFY